MNSSFEVRALWSAYKLVRCLCIRCFYWKITEIRAISNLVTWCCKNCMWKHTGHAEHPKLLDLDCYRSVWNASIAYFYPHNLHYYCLSRKSCKWLDSILEELLCYCYTGLLEDGKFQCWSPRIFRWSVEYRLSRNWNCTFWRTKTSFDWYIHFDYIFVYFGSNFRTSLDILVLKMIIQHVQMF